MTSKLDALFIVPYSEDIFGIVHSAYTPEFNLGVGSLVAYCRHNGYRADYIDMGAENYTLSSLCDYIKKNKPKVVGITIVTILMSTAIEIAAALKALDENILIAVGGPHPTALPEQTLKEGSFDVVVRGEGEITFLELLKRFFNQRSFKGLKGVTFYEGTHILSEPDTEPIKDLDILPFPYRKDSTIYLYKNQIYFDDPDATAYNLIATRGCPYKCTFCGQSIIFPRKVRKRSPENIFREINTIHEKYGIRYFFFEDSTFVFSKKLVEKLCSLILNSGLKIKWGAMGRLDLVDKDFYELMKRAGCVFLHFGVESGNEKILKAVKKRITLSSAQEAIETVRKIGIKFNTSFMLGFPEDTVETIRQTIDFAKKLNSDYVSFSLTTPYPGSELYDVVTANGWKVDSWKEYEKSRYNLPIYVPDNISREDLVYLFRRAYKEYYLRPKYIIHRIRNIKNWRQFVNHYKIGLSLMKVKL